METNRPLHCEADDGGRTLFCPCGKLREPGSLKTLRIQGFTGPQSISPTMERFWETGDPSVFSH